MVVQEAACIPGRFIAVLPSQYFRDRVARTEPDSPRPESQAGGRRSPRERRHVACVLSLPQLTPQSEAPGYREAPPQTARGRGPPESEQLPPLNLKPAATPLPLPASVWAAARAAEDLQASSAASQSSSQATARTTATTAGAARTPESVRRRGARPEETRREEPAYASRRPRARRHGVREGRRPRCARAFGPAVPRMPTAPAPESSGVSRGGRPGSGFSSSLPRPLPSRSGAGREEAQAP